MNRSDLQRNSYLLRGSLSKRGYMRWWHSFVGIAPDTGEQRTFFVEYLILNPSLGGNVPVLGQHPYFRRRGMKPSYVRVKAGVLPNAEGAGGLQLHGFYPITSLRSTKSPFILQAEDCLYSENRIRGYVEVSEEEARHRSFMTDAGSMEWDLEVHKAVACHTGFLSGPLACVLNALDSFWHGEGIRSFFRGSVTLDGKVYEVAADTSYGYADKHWGRSFSSPWFQFASCRLFSERTGKELKHSVIAVDGCSPRLLWLPLKRKIMLQLTYMGEDFEFFFTNPFCRSRLAVKTTNKRFIWHIKAQNKNAIIKLSLSCRHDQMMPLLYESPDGVIPGVPLYGGSAGIGTIWLYRRNDNDFELLDTLTVSNGLCAYQE